MPRTIARRRILEIVEKDIPERVAAYRNDEEYEYFRNTVEYLVQKDLGSKPRYQPGKYGKKYDYWSCGRCGNVIKGDVSDNYCWHCGTRILWDTCRCLTGIHDSEE